MPTLILGPMLRYIGPTEATIWVETDVACRVTILEHSAPTFEVEGHHYALVHMRDLKPASRYEYTVLLDGEQVWPETNSPYPPSVIRTFNQDEALDIAFGSCQVAMPNEPPYTLTKAESDKGFEIDALRALAVRMRDQPIEQWPDALILLGDQIYADEVAPEVREFIRSRRNTDEPPGEGLADFEEYAALYRNSWGKPDMRWLLSTLPSAMIFDDHELGDDWNISAAWVEEMRGKPWWNKRIVDGLMTYWIYQHLGNLSPQELYEDELFQYVQQAGHGDDLTVQLREFAQRADHQPDSYRWSFYRDYGKVRLLVMDSREARVLGAGRRDMMDEAEWRWVEEHAHGDFEHLLLATSLPILMGHGIHYLEAWDEAVCDGAWGEWAAKQGEKIRRVVDLEHWSAFQTGFKRAVRLIYDVASGAHGSAPETITILSGDVHHVYLAEADFPYDVKRKSAIYQAVCSPFRNPLDATSRRVMRACWSGFIEAITKTGARAAGVDYPEIQWRLCHDEPWFDNQVASLRLQGKQARIRFERSVPGDAKNPRLEQVLEQRLDTQG